MKSVFKNHFVYKQKFTGAMLYIAFFVASGCGNSSFQSEFEQTVTYPVTGKLGLKNILAEGFTEGKRLKLDEVLTD